jgi:hypothetical protein
MKTLNYLILCLTAFAFSTTFAQQAAIPARPISVPTASIPVEAPQLTKFNLDFPGGTPKQLIGAIEKAMGKTLNVMIPDEFAGTEMPPVKVNKVDLSQLFDALDRTSSYSADRDRIRYGFKTGGKPSDDSIWNFYVQKPYSQKSCRFYSLAPYLERGTTVDDITTAIQTGWKMLGEKDTPTINFHKDTKLLIAVGEPNKLETIDAVLKALSPASPEKAVPASEKPAPKPGKPKTEN